MKSHLAQSTYLAAKAPGFFQGALLAVLLSLGASAVYAVLVPVIGAGASLRLLIALCALVYILYLLSGSRERVGRITVLSVWAAVTGALYLLTLPVLLYAVAQAAMLWLIRALYFYSGVVPALADLGLNALALCAALWAGLHTHSFGVSVWCFFLTQALFVFIPKDTKMPAQRSRPMTGDNRFEQAYRSAESAVRKLSLPR